MPSLSHRSSYVPWATKRPTKPLTFPQAGPTPPPSPRSAATASQTPPPRPTPNGTQVNFPPPRPSSGEAPRNEARHGPLVHRRRRGRVGRRRALPLPDTPERPCRGTGFGGLSRGSPAAVACVCALPCTPGAGR